VKRFFHPQRLSAVLAVVLSLSGCSGGLSRDDGPPSSDVSPESVGDAVPRAEPKSKSGNPRSYVVFGQRYYTRDSASGFVERGIASWYGKKFHGRRTSSGETYDMYAMTAAHKELPLPTYVRVTNLDNGRSITVRVNDRGPFHEGRVIDLSYTAAAKLDIVRAGTAPVEVVALVPGDAPPSNVPAASSSQLFVQAGAFEVASNAHELVADLNKHLSSRITVVPVTVNGRPLHRVRIGPFDKVSGADGIMSRLNALGVSGARLIVD
jgi:rare lipoprotein A